MKLARLILLLITVTASITTTVAQTTTLTASNNHVRIDKIGTVTFSGPGITLEEIAQKEGLQHISGRTYRAAIIYDIAFSNGYITSRGKIFNCTDNVLNITCSFYSGSRLVTTYNIPVKPRTFSRMIPDEEPLNQVKSCNRIICTESGGSLGSVRNSGHSNRMNQTSSTSTRQNDSKNRYFTTETYFYGENSTNRIGVTYHPNGVCGCIGYVRDDDYWIKGTSEGRYYINNGTIYVRWDNWLDESYRLENNQYKNHDIILRRQ